MTSRFPSQPPAERLPGPRKSLSLAAFVLDRAVFEVRYDRAYLLWDRVGSIWHRIRHHGHELRTLEAEPNRVRHAISDKYEILTNLDLSSVTAFFPPKNLTDFMGTCDDIFEIVFTNCEIRHLTRVGLRLIYAREYPKLDDAATDLLALGLLAKLEGRHFGIDGISRQPEYAMRVEDGKLGFRVWLRVERQTVELEPTLGTKDIDKQHYEHNRLVYDIDHYTVAELTTSQLRPSEWIKDRLHLTNRDSAALLGG